MLLKRRPEIALVSTGRKRGQPRSSGRRRDRKSLSSALGRLTIDNTVNARDRVYSSAAPPVRMSALRRCGLPFVAPAMLTNGTLRNTNDCGQSSAGPLLQRGAHVPPVNGRVILFQDPRIRRIISQLSPIRIAPCFFLGITALERLAQAQRSGIVTTISSGGPAEACEICTAIHKRFWC